MSKPNESQIYLCRAFDQLNKGEDYISCNPAIQIGILDFTSNSSLAETKEALKASENEAARLKQLLIKHGINAEE